MTDPNRAVAIVTGASSGIGAAVARGLAEHKAQVLLCARDADGLEAAAEAIRAGGGQATPYPADLSDPAAVADMFTRIRASHGDPDLVVNAAGGGRWQFMHETSPAEAIAMVGAPYLAAFLVTRASLPAMLRRDRGHIVNLTSVAAFMTWPGATGYTAIRWAIRGLHEALRADLAHTGVRVTLATFAKVTSPYWHNNPGSEERLPPAQRSMRALSADEAAAAIVDGICRDRTHVVAPASLRRLLWFNRWFPGLVRRRLVEDARVMPTADGSSPRGGDESSPMSS